MTHARIIVTGLIAQHWQLGGVAWDYVQFAAGLARLGHDVYYVEDSGEWPYRLTGGPTSADWVADDCSANVEHLAHVLSRFGLQDRWAYRCAQTSDWFGLSEHSRRELFASADLLLNISGTLERPEDYREVPRLAYLDSDPVFTQIKLAQDSAFNERVAAHDVHFSFGELLTGDGLGSRYRWRPTRQPVLLDAWRPTAPARDVFTTILSWTSYPPLAYEGRTYGQKDLELRRFITLPERVPGMELELALGPVHHVDWQTADALGSSPVRHSTPRDLLQSAGWRVIDAVTACADLDSYRSYVESSKAEWSVAKNGYVVGRPGWFSCRSACYLAAGRPVVVQDTGFGDVLPVGAGVVAFKSIEEAADALREVAGNYGHHAQAAREVAAAYFDARHVLARLVEEALGSVECHRPHASSEQGIAH